MSAPTPDLGAAASFLEILDPSAEAFSFQTFDDGPNGSRSLAKVLHGPLDSCARKLCELQQAGAGVFVTINETNLKGRKATDITRVRAVFADLDGSPLEPVRACGLEPHIVVESSPGRFHAYWRVDDLQLDQFKSVQKAIAARFSGDKAVNDLPRVMRLPGFWHLKGEPFQTRLIESSAHPAHHAALISASFQPEAAPEATGTYESLRELVGQILTAESYHEPLARLAWRYLSGGMPAGKVVETLQGLMLAAEPHDERWQARYDDIERAVETATEKQGGQTSQQVILTWVSEKYRPRFVAKDGRVFSETLGRLIRETEIEADSPIIDRLAHAVDAPRLKGGNVNWNRLPAQFKTWRGVAWGDLKLTLPQEDELDHVPAAEELGERLATMLTAMYRMDLHGGAIRSFGTWAYLYASLNPGQWRRVSGLDLWGRVLDGVFQIALRPRLATQPIGRSFPEIGGLTLSQLTRRCRLCGLSTEEDNRVCCEGEVTRAAVLSAEFVRSLGLSYNLADPIAEALGERLRDRETEADRGLRGRTRH